MPPDGSVTQRLALATDLLKNGQTEQACAHLQALVTDVPALAIGWYLLGRMALSIGDAEVAIPMLEQAVSLDATHLESQLDLALAYFRGGRVEEAGRLYQVFLPHGPAVTARLPLEFRNALANVFANGGVDMEVRPATHVLDNDYPTTDITHDSLTAWIGSPDYLRELAYFEHYPSHSLLAGVSRILVYHIIRAMKPQLVAEVGSYKAGTAEVIARALWENGQGILHTTDPFGQERCPAIIACWPAELQQHVRYYARASMDFFLDLEASGQRLDIAFIDGNHDYEFAYFDLMMAARNLRRGGLILMDNIEQQGPLFATLEFLRNNPAWQVLGRNRMSLAALGNPMANGADRSSIEGEGASLLVLKAPFVHSVYLGAFSTRQVKVGISTAVCELLLHASPLSGELPQGTLYWEAVFREFPDGAFPAEHKRSGEVLLNGSETQVRLRMSELLKPAFPGNTQTFEINMQFSTSGAVPFAFGSIDMIPDTGDAWVFYQ